MLRMLLRVFGLDEVSLFFTKLSKSAFDEYDKNIS